MSNRIGWLHAGILCLLLAAVGCGGGGGGDGGVPGIGGTTYNAAMSIGDLFTYQLDTGTLQYRAEGIEGVYAGQVATGTLLPQAGWGDYVYETDAGDLVVLLPGKLVFVHTTDGELLAGVPRLTTSYSVGDIVGLYNYVYYEPATPPGLDYAEIGTFRLDADGSWHLWEERNGAAAPASPDVSGTWVDEGNGVLRAYEGATAIANVMVHPSGNGNVLVIDQFMDGGMAVGLIQQALSAGAYNGTYDVLDTDADDLYAVSVAGTTVTDPGGAYSVQYNWPWTGFAGDPADPDGLGVALTSGDGTWFGVFYDHTDLEHDILFAGIKR